MPSVLNSLTELSASLALHPVTWFPLSKEDSVPVLRLYPETKDLEPNPWATYFIIYDGLTLYMLSQSVYVIVTKYHRMEGL